MTRIKYWLEETLTPETIAAIDEFLASAPNAHFSQHPALSTWVRQQYPRAKTIYLIGEEGGKIRLAGSVLLRRTPVLGYWLVDIFRGPAADSPEILVRGLKALERMLAPRKMMAIRLDPYWCIEGNRDVLHELSRSGYERMERSPVYERTLEVQIDRDPDELLYSFKPPTRRDIQKAIRLNVEVREDLDEPGLECFCGLYDQMVKTKLATPRSLGFFRDLRDLYRRFPGGGFFLSSWLSGKMLAAIAIFTIGARAIYGFGASSATGPPVPKSHLLHYNAMLRARDRRFGRYDFGGFSHGAGEASNRTAVQKVNYFKSGFGGREIEFVPAHLRIVRPMPWRLLLSLNRYLSSSADRLKWRWPKSGQIEAAYSAPPALPP